MEKTIKTMRIINAILMFGLTVVLISLKLFKIISWSWLWVVSPIWITMIIALVLTAIVIIIGIYQKNHERN